MNPLDKLNEIASNVSDWSKEPKKRKRAEEDEEEEESGKLKAGRQIKKGFNKALKMEDSE